MCGPPAPRVPKLAEDTEPAASVGEGLKEGWSPPAVSAGLRAQGHTICAETIYRAS